MMDYYTVIEAVKSRIRANMRGTQKEVAAAVDADDIDGANERVVIALTTAILVAEQLTAFVRVGYGDELVSSCAGLAAAMKDAAAVIEEPEPMVDTSPEATGVGGE